MGPWTEAQKEAWKRILSKLKDEDKELLDRLGSDYDEDGIPYWEKNE